MADAERVYKGLFWCSTCTNEDPFNGCDECPYNSVSISVQECRSALCLDAAKLFEDQQKIIEQYHKADGFLAVHGWKWKE